MIAQEVEKVFPVLVNTDKATGLKSIEYANLIAPVIEALKELANRVEYTILSIADQKNVIDAQNKKIQSLEERLSKIEAKMKE